MIDTDALNKKLVSYAHAICDHKDWGEQEDAIIAAYKEIGGNDPEFQNTLIDYGISAIGAWTAADYDEIENLQARVVAMFQAAIDAARKED